MKYILRFGVCIMLCAAIGLGIVRLNSGYTEKSTPYEEKISYEKKGTTPDTLTQKVNTPPSKKDKYILKYDEDTEKISLTVRYKDGSEIISSVETINPKYLTNDDIKSLKKGIEFSSKEDMYILIEDYSS